MSADTTESRQRAARARADAAELAAAAAEAEMAAAEAELAAAEESASKAVAVDEGGGRRPAGTKRTRWIKVGAAALFAALLAFLGASAVQIVHHRAVVTAQERDREIIDAVRHHIAQVIAPSYEDAKGSAQRILDNATGAWAEELAPNTDAFADVLVRAKVQARAQVSAVAIEQRHADGGTEVLVAAVSEVRNIAAEAPSVRTWRLRVTVTQVDGAYKLSKVEQIA